MKYEVVTGYDFREFTANIQRKLDEGWQLQGGVSMAVNGHSNERYYAQALVLVEDKKEGS